MKLIKGNNIKFELVELEDSEFILELRNDENSKFLSKTSSSLDAQNNWIKNYKDREKREEEFYYIMRSTSGNSKLGTLRLYNIDYKSKTLCWGSWAINPKAPMFTAIESYIVSHEYIFDKMGFEKTIIDVNVNNLKVVEFFEKIFTTEKIETKNGFNYYGVTKGLYLKDKEKYQRFI